MTTLARGLGDALWTPLAAGRRARILAVVGIIAGTATVLAGVGLITSSGYLVSRASQRPPILDLMVVFVAVRFFGLARPALRYAERLVSHDLTFRILAAVRRRFVSALVPLSQGQLAGFRAGDLLSRLATDVETLQEAWLKVAAPAAVALLTTAAVTLALAWIDLQLGFAILALMLFNGIVWTWLAGRIEAGLGARQNGERRAFSADLVTLTQSLEDILAFGHERTALDRLADRQRALDAIESRYGVRQALHAGVSALVTHVAFGVALFLTLRAADRGDLPAVWVAAASLAVIAAFEAIDALPAAWQFAARTSESAGRVEQVIATSPAVVEDRFPVSFTRVSAPSIEFKDVTFGYDSRTILENVSLRVTPGEHVLITGPTGSGKSTLLALAMRAWDPGHGHVSLDGIDLRCLPIADLRAATAVLPQHIHVFNTTLRDNVRLAMPSAPDGDVIRALERARLGPFFDGLPQGLDTILGEFGAAMSAGERQRLGLARILMTDAALVLADEPTANLDVETERAVLDALGTWAAGRTLLLVSHRPVARLAVDRVLRLQDGRFQWQGAGSWSRADMPADGIVLGDRTSR